MRFTAIILCQCLLLGQQLPPGVSEARRPIPESAPRSLPDRAQALVRNGAIYLSLYDALALAIENNLDVKVARYDLPIAASDTLRARGGGDLRGIDYIVAESPTGVGGPGSPLLNSAAASLTPASPTVNELTSLNVVKEFPASLSVGGEGYSAGPAVPAFDPYIAGETSWFHRANASPFTASPVNDCVGCSPSSALDFTLANYDLVAGFSTGTQIEANLNNAAQVLYLSRDEWDPFSAPNVSITVTQSLLRGFGRNLNRRYLKISLINQKISRLVFHQQLIDTVYGVARLYYDLVSLNENVRVKRGSVAALRKLYEDDRAAVEQGSMPPIELTRAESLLSASELDLIQAEGLVKQQEVILKSQVVPRVTGYSDLENCSIVPTDTITIPQTDDLPKIDALVSKALGLRPDLAAASLQIASGEISLNASRNATRPELDVMANYQTRGSIDVPFGVVGLGLGRIYQAGIEFNLPLRNRRADADLARDVLELRQAQARTERLANQMRAEIETSVVGLETARAALKAALESRQYQERLLTAETVKLSVGKSTTFLMVQQQSYVAQARSTEVAARSIWIKARLALDRAVGDLLEKNGIADDESAPPNVETQSPR